MKFIFPLFLLFFLHYIQAYSAILFYINVCVDTAIFYFSEELDFN